MSEGLTTLQNELESVRGDLVKRHRDLGMPASGQWVSSLIVEAEESGSRMRGVIRGLRYTEQLQFGRRPGKFPPIHAIEKWIEAKNITSDIPTRSLAFLIARKIAREGTKYFQQGGTGLVSDVITDERIDEIVGKVGDELTKVVVSGFVAELKKMK